MWISFFLSCFSLLSIDAFRSQADHFFETLDPKKVEVGQTIFIKTADLDVFFRHYHPEIPVPYTLISHVTDEEAPGGYASYLDDPKLLGWYAINWDGTAHPKLHPIPIGLGPSPFPQSHLDAMARVQKKGLKKEHLLFMNFTIQTFYSERWEVFKRFAHEPYCFRTGRRGFEEYLIDMASSKFVLAPRGAGLDTYRLWEALYVGAIPIVKSSSLDPLYEGLPVLIVREWSEVTEQFLEEKYETFSRGEFSWEKLTLFYWILNKK